MRYRILVLILAMAVFRMVSAQPEAQSMATQYLVHAQVQGAMSRTQLQVWAGGHEDYAAFLSC
jgi:hypothetical protein